MDQAMAGWPARVAAEAALERRGRTLDADVLIEVGDTAWLAAIRRGHVLELRRGPFVLPSFTLALRITAEGMARFLAPAPVPATTISRAITSWMVLYGEGPHDTHRLTSFFMAPTGGRSVIA